MLLAAVIAHAQTDVMVMMDKNESSEFVRMYPGKKKKDGDGRYESIVSRSAKKGLGGPLS